MPMMNSEARKRAQARASAGPAPSSPAPASPTPAAGSAGRLRTPAGGHDPRLLAAQLADRWDAEADAEDAGGNGFAAVILHAHARELRAELGRPLSA